MAFHLPRWVLIVQKGHIGFVERAKRRERKTSDSDLHQPSHSWEAANHCSAGASSTLRKRKLFPHDGHPAASIKITELAS